MKPSRSRSAVTEGLKARPSQPEQPQGPRHSPYLTAHEAVEYLRLGSLSALYRLIREWELPYGRVGRSYRFHQGQLDRWIERRGVAALNVVRSA